MTAVREASSWRDRRPVLPSLPPALRVRRVPRASTPTSGILVVSYALSILATAVGVLLFNLTVVSQFQHFTAQHSLYKELRVSLAQASAPIGQTDAHHHLVTPGTPIALLSIPEIGVHEVVVEGTSSRQTKIGAGHRRDTPYPGQPGVSVLMGRAAAYGGDFRNIHKLKPGDTFKVTTGQGVSTYKVIGQRTGNVKLPALGPTDGRLTLITASGFSFLPHDVLRVDADLVSKSFPRPPIAFGQGVISDSENSFAGDPSRMFSLSWLMELLVILAVAAAWAWKRWSHPAMWIVFVPLLAATSLACADRVCELLPNLL